MIWSATGSFDLPASAFGQISMSRPLRSRCLWWKQDSCRVSPHGRWRPSRHRRDRSSKLPDQGRLEAGLVFGSASEAKRKEEKEVLAKSQSAQRQIRIICPRAPSSAQSPLPSLAALAPLRESLP